MFGSNPSTTHLRPFFLAFFVIDVFLDVFLRTNANGTDRDVVSLKERFLDIVCAT